MKKNYIQSASDSSVYTMQYSDISNPLLTERMELFPILAWRKFEWVLWSKKLPSKHIYVYGDTTQVCNYDYEFLDDSLVIQRDCDETEIVFKYNCK